MTHGHKVTNIGWGVVLVYGCPVEGCGWAPPHQTLSQPSDEEEDAADAERRTAILDHAEAKHTVSECIDTIWAAVRDDDE